MRIVALDQGTTSTKALVWDNEGPRLAFMHRHRQFHPAPGRVEHDPAELLAGLRAAITTTRPEALAIANQGESCLAWDRITGAALSPVIVWQDNRTEAECRALEREGAGPIVAARSGLPLDPYFSASKLGWLMRNLPEVQAAYRAGRLCLGTTDAFFLQALTGRAATDPSTASRTALMNLASCQWDPELCALFGVPSECLPEIRPTAGDFGSIDGVAVVASVTDQQAALYGHGCREKGATKMTFGTGAFALALTGTSPQRGEGLLPTVAWQIGNAPVQYAVDGGVYDVGAAVEWAQRAGLIDGPEALDCFDRPPAIDRGLVFVPAFSGLACPWWDRSAAPVLIGLGHDSDRRDMAQALVEGMALMSASVIDAIDRIAPLKGNISIDGGVSRSGAFAQMLADCSGRTVTVRSFADLTALGAAQLAAAALGLTREAPAQQDRRYLPRDVPRADWQARFAQAVARARGWRQDPTGR
ncbi:FGGY family carbohydrate kinase [Plastorhodobacter daqingensis]|uniref:FGGY family carbohydrate kinase n=1 Tax=Plastorhodobacter daqingensis TaxID=1387281 RepID=A0ABW2UIW4_9RHOB